MEDSWENWLSAHLGKNMGDCSIINTSVSSLSFEEMKSLNGEYCDSSSIDINNAMGEIQGYSLMESSNFEEEIGLGKRIREHELEMRGTKKCRTSSQALNHIMSERKRRQDLAQKFIALSATIPGLKKIDKGSILEEARNYVEQLEQRIAELEKGMNNQSTKITKSCETCSTDCYVANEVLPEIEARRLEKEILIRIHCEKRKGIDLNIFALLKDLHLSITSTSVLPFANSLLNIIIIAQVSEKYKLSVEDLVKTLKQVLKLHEMQN